MNLKKIPLRLANCPAEFLNYPIETGIPFPRGLLSKTEELSLSDASGKPLPCDIFPVLRWPDGSVQWADLHFLASDRECFVQIGPNERNASPPELGISQAGDEARIDTGAAQFSVSCDYLGISAAPSGLRLDRDLLADSRGRRYRFKIRSSEFERRGALTACLLLKGEFVGGSNGAFCHGECRLSFWAGTGLLRVEFTLWNPKAASHRGGLWDLGDPRSIYFRSLHLRFRFSGSGPEEAVLSVEPGGEIRRSEKLSIHQSSTGGPNWRSLVHVDKNNVPTPKFSGYLLRDGDESSTGLKANPAVVRRTGASAVAFALENFWQRFPSRLQAGDGMVSVEPFPAEDGQDFELQGGEQATFRAWIDCDCREGAEGDALLPARIPIVPSLPAEWYCGSGCFAHLQPGGREDNSFFRKLILSAVGGENSFFARRNRFEEYGWRNFGDIHADHERLHYKGSAEFVSHYNNQYDMIFGFLQQFASTGDFRWFILAKDLSRHVLDHDLYHTDQDKAAYNGGYFWHTAHYLHAGTASHRSFSRRAAGGDSMPKTFGGGPSNEHNYSAGLLYYYLLAGDSRAKAAVMQLARWVRDMQDGRRTPYRFFSLNDTGYATSTGDISYQGPGRGAAYSIQTCLDAFALSENPDWLQYAGELIRTCVHPDDDPASFDLLNREARWSYVVFLQTLGKYLDLMRDRNRLDADFHYAAACLLKLAKWMAAKEYAYFDKPEQLEYPTSTWSAQEIRKTSVFLIAAAYARNDADRALFEERAEHFAAKCAQQLEAAEDGDCARNMAIVLASVPIYFAFKGKGTEKVETELKELEWGERRVLLPQKIDARRNLKRIIKTGGIALVAHLFRLWRSQRGSIVAWRF